MLTVLQASIGDAYRDIVFIIILLHFSNLEWSRRRMNKLLMILCVKASPMMSRDAMGGGVDREREWKEFAGGGGERPKKIDANDSRTTRERKKEIQWSCGVVFSSSPLRCRQSSEHQVLVVVVGCTEKRRLYVAVAACDAGSSSSQQEVALA